MDALLAFPAILLAIALMAVPLGLLAGYVGGRLDGLVKDGPRTRDGAWEPRRGRRDRVSGCATWPRQPLIAPAVMPRTNHSDRKR